MKKLSVILFLIPSFLFSQDSLELKTIKRLNEYRASKGLHPLVLDQGLCKAADHQVQFELLSDSVTHYQYKDFPNFEEILEAEDRIKKFSGVETPRYIEITLGSYNGGVNSQFLNPTYYDNHHDKIIEYFTMSKSHNMAMLQKEANKVGIRVVIDKNHYRDGVKKTRDFCVITFGI